MVILSPRAEIWSRLKDSKFAVANNGLVSVKDGDGYIWIGKVVENSRPHITLDNENMELKNV